MRVDMNEQVFLHKETQSLLPHPKKLRLEVAAAVAMHVTLDVRELKNPRRRRRGQRRLKNELIFYLGISRYPKLIYFVYLCQSYHETESRTHR